MRVRALRDVFYAGRDYRVGEEFDTENEMHGKLMIASAAVEQQAVTEMAKDAKRGRYQRRDMRADE
jgi:hypothetical protein